MADPIKDLSKVYTEKISMQARKSIINGEWDNEAGLKAPLLDFKKKFSQALVFLRNPNCTRAAKTKFLESVYRAELRVLLYEIISIKKIPHEEAEDVCQEIIIALLKRLVGSGDTETSNVKVYSLSQDDYKAFVYYCLQSIKNYGYDDMETIVDISVEEK